MYRLLSLSPTDRTLHTLSSFHTFLELLAANLLTVSANKATTSIHGYTSQSAK